VQEVEDLIEHFNTLYDRHTKQRGLDQWGERLLDGGRLRLAKYEVHRHAMRLRSAQDAVDLMDSMGFIRNALGAAKRTEFGHRLRQLTEAHFGRDGFDFPLETKLYILKHAAAPEATSFG
jgi:hypothetical protein